MPSTFAIASSAVKMFTDVGNAFAACSVSDMCDRQVTHDRPC
jgi:hypothetical protein